MNYLAYGSNLHPHRLRARVPSATFLSVVALPGWQLRFHKRGADTSAKCNVISTGHERDVVYGALYELADTDRKALDVIEGLGSGYEEYRLITSGQGEFFFYVAHQAFVDDSLRPFAWYKQLVLAGARYHRLTASYIAMIDQVRDMPDPDAQRESANRDLLHQLLAPQAGAAAPINPPVP